MDLEHWVRLQSVIRSQGKQSDNRINALTCTLTLRCTRKSLFTHFNAHCLPRAWCKTSTFQTEISNASLVVWIPFHCAFYNVFWPFIPLKTVSTSFHNEETPVSHVWRDLLVQHNVIWLLFVCGPNFTPCKCAGKKKTWQLFLWPPESDSTSVHTQVSVHLGTEVIQAAFSTLQIQKSSYNGRCSSLQQIHNWWGLKDTCNSQLKWELIMKKQGGSQVLPSLYFEL